MPRAHDPRRRVCTVRPLGLSRARRRRLPTTHRSTNARHRVRSARPMRSSPPRARSRLPSSPRRSPRLLSRGRPRRTRSCVPTERRTREVTASPIRAWPWRSAAVARPATCPACSSQARSSRCSRSRGAGARCSSWSPRARSTEEAGTMPSTTAPPVTRPRTWTCTPPTSAMATARSSSSRISPWSRGLASRRIEFSLMRQRGGVPVFRVPGTCGNQLVTAARPDAELLGWARGDAGEGTAELVELAAPDGCAFAYETDPETIDTLVGEGYQRLGTVANVWPPGIGETAPPNPGMPEAPPQAGRRRARSTTARRCSCSTRARGPTRRCGS